MIIRYPILYAVILSLTLLLLLSGVLMPQFWSQYSWIVAVVLILFVGIPHGATDHLIFSRLSLRQWGRVKWSLFFLAYLGLMGLYALGWWQFPVFSLVLFLLMSAYHFGQANWSFMPLPRKKAQFVVSLIWGLWVIFTPLLFHSETSLAIVSQIVGSPVEISGNTSLWAGLLLLVNLSMVLYLRFRGWINRNDFLREVLHLALLELSFFVLPLLLSFAVYFTLWHSLGSMQDQVAFFSGDRPKYRWGHYLRQILPMTILALLGLGAFVFWQYSDLMEGNLASLFVFIAVLTLPHMILMEKLYENLNNSK